MPTIAANDLNIQQPGIVVFDGAFSFLGRSLVAGTGITITNNDGTAGNPTIALSGGAQAVEHLTGNTGGQLNPDGSNNFNLLGTANQITTTGAGSTITYTIPTTFVAPGSITSTTSTTVTLGNLTVTAGNAVITAGNLTLPNTNSGATQGIITFGGNVWISNYGTENTFIGQTSGNSSLTVGSATQNTGCGYNTLPALTTGSLNCAFGGQCMLDMQSGTQNTAMGQNSLEHSTADSNNTCLGFNAGRLIAGGASNTIVGSLSGNSFTTGASNTIVGESSGTAYTTSESGNIIVGQGIAGTIAESNVTRIGGSSQAKCFITGITGVTVSNSELVTINSSTSQIGVQALTQYALLSGGASNALNQIAAVAANQVLSSTGTTSQPAYTGYPQVSGLGIGASPGSTAGLTFDGTNFLDAYAQGTFSPTYQTTNGDATGITYSIQTGTYTRIGNIVFVAVFMTWSNTGAGTGTACLNNLPFTVKNLANYYPTGPLQIQNILFTAPYLQCSAITNTTQVFFNTVNSASGTGNLGAGVYTNASVGFSVTYQI